MKKILFSLTVLFCAAAIGVGIYSYQNAAQTSDLTSQNIEALAQNHGFGYMTCCMPTFIMYCSTWGDSIGHYYEIENEDYYDPAPSLIDGIKIVVSYSYECEY